MGRIVCAAVVGLLATLVLQAQPAERAARPRADFRGGVDLITLNVTVTDREQRFVANLGQRDFTILEDDRPQTVAFFAHSGVPMTVVLAIDTSGSMDDALRAAQETEPVEVLVLRDLADELRTVAAAQAGNDVVDVIDGEHDAAYAQRVRRRALRLGSDRRRRVELRQLNPAVAVRSSHHGDVGSDAVEPDDAVHRRPLDLRLAFQLHAEFGEERFGSVEVVDNDEDVVHPLKGHVVVSRCRGPRLPWPFT